MGYGRTVTSREWKEMSKPDIYFTEEYHTTAALAEPNFSEAVLLEWSDESGYVRMPLILREIAGSEYFDATSAYGYGGPWVEGHPNLVSFKRFFQDWAHDRRVVSSFLRFHPLIANAEIFSRVLPVKEISKTAAWNLEASEDLVQGMAKNHRKNWRRATRAGVQSRVMHNPGRVDDFRQLYELSMGRLSAKDFYWFSDNYWTSLRDDLGKSSLLVEAIHEGQTVAAAWCLVTDKYLHFHLSGTSDEGRRLGGAFVCRVAAAQWAKNEGLRMAHHGGGADGPQSSLLEWKRKFDESTPLQSFCVAEVVHNQRVFNRMSEGYSVNEYFPPWRNPEFQYAEQG